MLSNEMRQLYRYYAHMDHTDAARNEGQMVNSMNIQMQRINELKGILKRFLTFNEQEVALQPTRPAPQQSHPASQPQMNPHVQPFPLNQPPVAQVPQQQGSMGQQQQQQQPQQQNYYQQPMF